MQYPKKVRKYLVTFVIKGAVEVEASCPAQAKLWVANDPLGSAKGDVDMDLRAKEIKEPKE